MKYLVDRMTVSWNGETECHQAEQFRRLVGPRNLSRQLKVLALEWLRQKRGSRKV